MVPTGIRAKNRFLNVATISPAQALPRCFDSIDWRISILLDCWTESDVAELAYAGVVGAIHLRIQVIDPEASNGQIGWALSASDRLIGPTHSDYSEETRLLGIVTEQRSQLLERIRQVVREVDGRLEADSMVIQRGSVEIFVILSTAYTVVTNFNEFIDVAYKTAENVRRVFRDLTAATVGTRNFIATGQFKVDPTLQALAVRADGAQPMPATPSVPQPQPGTARGAWADMNTVLLAVIVVVLDGMT
jgi:hypothetical protein